MYMSCVSSLLLLDHSGGDKVLRGVHQDSAHRLRGVWSLSETTFPSSLQRPDQVRMKYDLPPADELFLDGKNISLCFVSLSFSPLRPSRRQFPRVMPLSKPGEGTSRFMICDIF